MKINKINFLNFRDTTATGHILGRAGERNQNQAVFQDRNLENSSLVLLRLFTHMSMFIGCNFKPEVRF